MIDFDLLKIRQKLQAKPVSIDVKAREDFIDKKLRRRMRKVKTAAVVGETVQVTETKHIDPPPPAVVVEKPKQKTETKQKHRPPAR